MLNTNKVKGPISPMVYIKGHGTTNAEYLCFLPPIFTKISMAENYGKTLVTNVKNPSACKQVKETVFGLINDILVSFIGSLVTLDETYDNNLTLNLLFQNTGIILQDKRKQFDNGWINDMNIYGLFAHDLIPFTLNYKPTPGGL